MAGFQGKNRYGKKNREKSEKGDDFGVSVEILEAWKQLNNVYIVIIVIISMKVHTNTTTPPLVCSEKFAAFWSRNAYGRLERSPTRVKKEPTIGDPVPGAFEEHTILQGVPLSGTANTVGHRN